MSKSEQIRILKPGGEHPHGVFRDVFALTILTCSVLFAIALPGVFLVKHEGRVDLSQDQPALIEEAAGRLRLMSLQEVRAGLPRWDLETKKAALIYGPRHASETLCDRMLDDPAPEDVALRELLAASLAERAEHAPRICLITHLFAGTFTDAPRDLLTQEVERYWSDVAAFKTLPGQDAFLVNTLVERGALPASHPQFVRWMRRCAVRTQEVSWLSCVRGMRELAPAHGHDLLEMVELHLVDRPVKEQPLEQEQLLEVVGLLAKLGVEGSPEPWRVTTHPHLLNYDYDLQLASVFTLCRFVMSNDRDVASMAGEGLAMVANKQLIMSDKGLFRMRETCRITFGGHKHDVEIASVPVLAENKVPELAVLMSSLDETPRYAFADLIERGDCVMEEGYPLWMCGAKLWKGEGGVITDALVDSFINTRYVEWVPFNEVPDVNEGIVRDPPGDIVEPDQNINP